MFNLLGVLGIPGIMTGALFDSSIKLDPSVLNRDYPVMIALSVLLFIFAYGFRGEGRLNRFEGGILLMCYAAYMVTIYQQSV